MSSKFIPISEESMDFLAEYMKGFWVHLKSPAEKSYCAERSFQLVHGIKRPVGMSGAFGVQKHRVKPLEIVIRKVWLKGVSKWEAKQEQELKALYEELATFQERSLIWNH